MAHRTFAAIVAATTLGLAGIAAAAPAVAAPGNDAGNGRPSSYALTGDAAGSRFEGIGADERRGVFYVSEVTGGEIHRGTVGSSATEEWLPEGADGRFTARGITVDAAGNVYIAGGPNGLGTGRPDVWVYSPEGELLAALRMPADDVFVNDVAIGPDGAAYFTDSNDARIYRVADAGAGFTAAVWADASDVIDRAAGFNLGGIVLSTDRSAFVVAQGNVGKMWRFGFDGSVNEIVVRGADLVNADGLVRQGSTLTVVRNFSHALTTLRVTADGAGATLVADEATAADKVFTTAKTLHGRILFVESEFGPDAPTPPYQVTTNPF
ncbi:SMP-30/gluconolactonase/LRE family protein [Microbacterium sp. NEAU-LLC]|uniref:SMP-30/gluconolactonase/LRE family protein n=1 Tax=Microbacterium helvum TaxID=2773713 RepID=A0ABR8NLB6_9MICO|nr:SMP-30/gluconolactonase/LRE family protein [Microbacterium helvum]MBD3941237.1 SMP-30/gluconolactonase/LRE family protein [Microbacterium helvum]